MTPRNTAILGAAAAVVLALGLVFGTGNQEQRGELPQGQLAFPSLAAKLGEAARIEVLRHGAAVHLARKDDSWTVAEADFYRARQDRVRELTTALTELKLSEPRSSSPEDYARLGVEDAEAKDAASTQVRLLDAAGGVLAQLLVGHERIGNAGNGDGVYVRRPGEAQAWLAEGRLAVEADAQQWLDRDIVGIPADNLASLLATRGAQSLGFGRQGEAWALTAPADHPGLDKFKLDDVSRALDGLAFEKVRPAPAPGAELGRTTIATKDGMTIAVTLSKSGPDLWGVFSASGGKAAEALQAKWAGWAYQLPAYKEAALAPTLDDLRAYQPPPAPAPGAPPPPPAPGRAPAPLSKPPGK